MATELAYPSQAEDSASVRAGISAATNMRMTTRYLDIETLASVYGGRYRDVRDPRCNGLEKIAAGNLTRKQVAQLRAFKCNGGNSDGVFQLPTEHEVAVEMRRR